MAREYDVGQRPGIDPALPGPPAGVVGLGLDGAGNVQAAQVGGSGGLKAEISNVDLYERLGAVLAELRALRLAYCNATGQLYFDDPAAQTTKG